MTRIEKNNGSDDGPASETIPQNAFSLKSDAFLLDVDGTILDIAPSPEQVRVPPSLRHSLSLLNEMTDGAIALVSGRPAAVLDQLFSQLALAVIGCHGAEWRKSSDEPITARSELLSEEFKRGLLRAIAAEPKIRVEDKGYSLALHYRQAPDREVPLLHLVRRHLASCKSELRLLHGKSMIEIKSRDCDKGEAVKALMREPPFAGRRPVYFGDDTTDEDAFAAVRTLGGLGISVGSRMKDAELMVPTPRAVRLLLARLAGNGSGESE